MSRLLARCSCLPPLSLPMDGMSFTLIVGCSRGSVCPLLALLLCGCSPCWWWAGGRKSNAGWCIHRFCLSPSRIPPLGWRWMAECGAQMSYRCHHQFQGRSSFSMVFGLCNLCCP
ncbi:hypothetical protein PVAP13_5NG134681 [Panicum virgatum]|uniref:Uncharacterized protein n=1 Tax=Panicum virgatum TaxID=38727 RepID=A0A8T0RS43_PANVG|nr:hypothetical protein PVAP13_5NG134681 [Panicum virgatum]